MTNWIYFNGGESALLAILYHTAANTFGSSFAPMFSGPDLGRQFWLLAVVNCVLALALALLAGPNRPWTTTAERRTVPIAAEDASA